MFPTPFGCFFQWAKEKERAKPTGVFLFRSLAIFSCIARETTEINTLRLWLATWWARVVAFNAEGSFTYKNNSAIVERNGLCSVHTLWYGQWDFEEAKNYIDIAIPILVVSLLFFEKEELIHPFVPGMLLIQSFYTFQCSLRTTMIEKRGGRDIRSQAVLKADVSGGSPTGAPPYRFLPWINTHIV